MATPEQNTLLAMQLFSEPARQFGGALDARTGLLLRQAMLEREAAARREQMAHQRGLAELQFDRYALLEEGRDRRAQTALRARDEADIQNELDRLYPQYAAAAARAGIQVKQRDEYEESRAGVGQLAADLTSAQVQYERRGQTASADAALGELDFLEREVETAKNRLLELSKPSADDEKFARRMAVAALRQAIEQGEVAGAEDLRPKAIEDGLSALEKGDLEVARRFLGDTAIGAYEMSFEGALMGLPNTKARLQERAQAQQTLRDVSRNYAIVQSDLRRAGAANPILSEKLVGRRSGLQMQLPDEGDASLNPVTGRPARDWAAITAELGTTGSETQDPPPALPVVQDSIILPRGTAVLAEAGNSEGMGTNLMEAISRLGSRINRWSMTPRERALHDARRAPLRTIQTEWMPGDPIITPAPLD